MVDIKIKRVTTDDITILQEIGKQTFAETSSGSTSEKNLATYLKEGFSSEKLTGELNNVGSQFYFILKQDKVIGYMKLNEGQAQSELKNEKGLEIQRIYVLGAYHGQKVGQLLYDHAMQVAFELKSAFIWLCVWEENPRAIRFYQKNGFVEFDRHIFKLGEDEQNDIMMKKNLVQ